MKLKRVKLFIHKNSTIVILLILSVVLLLIARAISNPQETRERAAGTARLYFAPASTTAAPIRKNINDTISLDVMIDPGQSMVSFVRFEVLYDQTKIAVNGQSAVAINSSVFPVTFEGPLVENGKINASISVGNDPTKAVTTPSKIATITFTALANTGSTIQVRYGSPSQALSIGANEGATDNVLGSTEPVTILIGPSNGITPTNGVNPSSTITTSISPTTSVSPSNPISPTIPGISPTPGNVVGCTLTVKTTQNVYDIAAVGQQLWIATTNGIIRIDQSGQQIGQEIVGNGLDSPAAITVVDQSVWVVNRFDKKIIRIAPNGTITEAPLTLSGNQIPGAVRLSGIAVVGQEVWITDEENGKIYRVDKTGELTATPISIDTAANPLDTPQAISIIGNEVWIVNSNYHNRVNSIPDILRFGTVGTFISGITKPGRTNDELPLDILATSNDILYLVGNVDARVLRLNTDGTVKGTLLTIPNVSAKKFAVNDNKIYVLEHSGTINTIRIYNLDGTPFVCPTPNPSVVTPTDIPRTTFVLNLRFHGIGSGGDSTNPGNSTLSNQRPVHQERMLNIQIVNEDNQIVATKLAPAFYNSDTGEFFSHGVITEPIPEGDYVVKVKTDPYLRKIVPGFLTVNPDAKNNMPVTDMVTGDINGDNLLNALDYNLLYDCGYGVLKPLPMLHADSAYRKQVCQSHGDKENTDLDDNGTIDATDYNLFIRELAVGFGQ